MNPVVILDTNALFGQNAAFTNSTVRQLTSLSSRRSIRLVIPEVVLLELARQWAKEVRDARTKLEVALQKYNAVTAKAHVNLLSIHLEDQEREVFAADASAYLESVHVEMPAYPADLTVDEVLERDLDYRKPFAENGKGFRDALIWETVRELCEGVPDGTPVIFVTDNLSDFCAEEGGALHPDLQLDLAPGRVVQVLTKLSELGEHPQIKPLADGIRAAEFALTPPDVLALVDVAFEQLVRRPLTETIGDYEGEGIASIPIYTPLNDPQLSDYSVDPASLKFSFFHTAGPSEMGLRVTVESEWEIDGYLDRSDVTLYYDEHSTVHVNGDWNRWTVTASDRRMVRIDLGASFSLEGINAIALQLERVEDITAEAE